MPDFRLSEQEASDLTQFVRSRSTGVCDASTELEAADAKRGQRLFAERGCQQCHVTRPDGSTATPHLASVFGEERSAGCLGHDNAARRKAPDFGFDASERAALVAFCRSSGESLARDSDAASAQRLVATLRCSACHVREERNRVLDAESELGIAPELLPSLTWAGEKLHSDWVADQVAGRLAYRPRPWLAARMPAFGPYAEPLARGLAASHGLGPSHCAAAVSTPANRESARIGERLTQKEGGLDCRLCHALGEENLRLDNRAQGIGFSFIPERMRPEFYDRWMLDPTRIDPQTAMPRFSPNGVSTKISEVLGGDAQQQFHAIWSYLQSVESQREPSTKPR